MFFFNAQETLLIHLTCVFLRCDFSLELLATATATGVRDLSRSFAFGWGPTGIAMWPHLSQEVLRDSGGKTFYIPKKDTTTSGKVTSTCSFCEDVG